MKLPRQDPKSKASVPLSVDARVYQAQTLKQFFFVFNIKEVINFNSILV